MNIIHGFWLPASGDTFIQSGQFWLWVETDQLPDHNLTDHNLTDGNTAKNHPRHLAGAELSTFLKNQWQWPSTEPFVSHAIMLPTCHGDVLPSPELRWVVGNVDSNDDNSNDGDDTKVGLKPWQVECVALDWPLQALSQIHFLTTYQQDDCVLGSDFLFWHYFAQSVKQLMVKDQYLPGLMQGAKKQLYRFWQIVSADYETTLESAIKHMPLVCAHGFEPQSLLRHFTEVTLNKLLDKACSKMPQGVQKPFNDTLIESFFAAEKLIGPLKTMQPEFEQWHQWQHKVTNVAQNADMQLCFKLVEGTTASPDSWSVEFVAASRRDASFKQSLAAYWRLDSKGKNALEPMLGSGFEHQVLSALGGAAAIYPKLWQGMTTQQPECLSLNLAQAFEFLKETAWVLEDAGYKVIVPSWWTPKGRRRTKVRLRTKGRSSSSSADSSKGLLSMDNLVDYRYELAIGDEPVSADEWAQLVTAKSPLVQFRGEWVELEQDKMADMLAFWRDHGDEERQLGLPELLKKLAEEEDIYELNQEDGLALMLQKLANHSTLEPVDNPEQLNASLRDYQKRGVSWLRYLEQLGLNGCLADDMGLGKTIQVIANLVMVNNEKTTDEKSTTLLIAPTSVMGNWQKEVSKFAPQLSAAIHHGNGRVKDNAEFLALCGNHHMVITSYSLARKDAKLLSAVNWQRIVLDEAQNIKNPKSAQAKAIFKLNAVSRLALTGTPVENRLMDLWSIFNFLNPGYLGTQATFRKNYELPIQRENSATQSVLLKKLIAPFVLRRLKTDKNIIKDLPDKIENKLYCNLSTEQAALYEAVVTDVEQQMAEKEGIELKGLMLSTLTKLKQICNHPMQFLQDGSEFSPQRAHKLERLGEMLDEAQADGDSVLIFTQFTDIGEQLVKYLSHEKQLNCYYLHGGVSRKKRETMIDEFQHPNNPASVFVLSLKAGGVGITLTRANHVFHFDRWWNPAVEDQATDRAFRIGQRKKVFVHKFITLGTLEERIDEMIEDKKTIAGSIVGDDESWLSKLDSDAFKSLIALNKQAVV